MSEMGRGHVCSVCGGRFELEDMELLEDDEQACLRCAQVSGAGDLQPVVSPGTPAPDERIVA